MNCQHHPALNWDIFCHVIDNWGDLPTTDVLAVVDAAGRTASFSGKHITSIKGEVHGRDCIAIGNILKKSEGEGAAVNPALFVEAAEKGLHAAMQTVVPAANAQFPALGPAPGQYVLEK